MKTVSTTLQVLLRYSSPRVPLGKNPSQQLQLKISFGQLLVFLGLVTGLSLYFTGAWAVIVSEVEGAWDGVASEVLGFSL